MIERNEEFIRNLAEGCNLTIEEVQAEWDAVTSDTFVSTGLASGKLTEEKALTYIMSAVNSRFTSLAAADTYNFVVVGFSAARKPKSGGDEYSELYAVFPSLDRTR